MRRLLLLLLLAVPAIAQKNELAVSLGRSEFDQLGDGPAVGISYNRFWTESVSTRFALVAAREDDETVGSSFAAAEYHFLRGRRVSPYAGLGFALAAARTDSASDTGFAPVIVGGIDMTMTERFAIGVDVSYLQFDADLDDRFPLALDPTTVLLSAKFRY